MRILTDEKQKLDGGLTEYFERVLAFALGREGIDCEGIEVSLSFVSEDEIRGLNRDYRSKDAPTDVLSFPMYEDISALRSACGGVPALLGDVVICREAAEKQAADYGHSVTRELVYLFAHSIFHLLGYDHDDEAERGVMRAAEEAAMSEIGLKRL